MPPATVQAIFKADVQKLPAYTGASVGGSYMHYKVLKVTQPEKIDEARRKGLQNEYASIIAQEDLSAYLSSIRSRYKIVINKSLVEAKERQ